MAIQEAAQPMNRLQSYWSGPDATQHKLLQVIENNIS